MPVGPWLLAGLLAGPPDAPPVAGAPEDQPGPVDPSDAPAGAVQLGPPPEPSSISPDPQPEPGPDPAPEEDPLEGSELEWDGESMDDYLAGFEEGEEGGEGPAIDSGGTGGTRRGSDIATGAVRMTGGYLHFPDIPELYPTGDDGIAAGVLRMIVDQELTEHLGYEMNVFADLTRTPAFAGGSGGTFQTAGATESAYRSPHLSFAYWDNGQIRGSAGLDRFALRAHSGRFNFAFGRFPVNYSVTNIFTPNDVFAPFAATAINRIYKPGVDAASFSVGIGALSAVEVVGAMGYADDGDPSWGRAALMGRASAVVWKIEGAVMGGKIAERWFAGASLQGDIAGPVGFRAESHVGFPDEDGDGKLDRAEEGGDEIYVRAAGGPSVMFTWHNVLITAEYGYYMDGADDPEDYIERFDAFYPDDVPWLGQHYVGWSAGMEIIPILTVNTIGLVNAADGSGLAGGFLAYNIADEADFVGGVYVPWGKGVNIPDVPLLPPTLRSEFGVSPVSVFLETRFYF